ncbi:MAG: hypothetical protein LUH14_04360 [Clostridiaceae bacterium]|nr:hypothetical protein [Clostridiaceae bacterium]
MARTKIVILQLRELIYTAIFVGIGIVLLIILAIMFWPGKEGKNEQVSLDQQTEEIYEAGIYTKEVKIGDTTLDLQLSLDENCVKSVELINLDESVETMYPLMEPTVEKISEQLSAGKSVDEIVLSEESQYTEKVIVESVSEMLREHEKQ